MYSPKRIDEELRVESRYSPDEMRGTFGEIVADALQVRDHDYGQLETLERTVDALRASMGRLLERLVVDERMTIDDVEWIIEAGQHANRYDFKTLAPVKTRIR